jgi:hypothetical protein
MLSKIRIRSSGNINRRRFGGDIVIKVKQMKKPITLDTLLVVLVTIVLAGIGGWVNIHSVLADHEARLKNVEASNQAVIQKLDKLQETTTSILVKMEDKQDRRK